VHCAECGVARVSAKGCRVGQGVGGGEGGEGGGGERESGGGDARGEWAETA
jgi:hypothetical protein